MGYMSEQLFLPLKSFISIEFYENCNNDYFLLIYEQTKTYLKGISSPLEYVI